MHYEALTRVLHGFEAQRALVLGDLMLDRFVYGSVERISPEAPVPVMSLQRMSDMPGGAGNVARNLAALGARATLLAVVGADPAAEVLRTRLSLMRGIDARLLVDAARPTTVKTRYIAAGQQMLRTDEESREALARPIEQRLIAELEDMLPRADIVVVSDYAKGTMTDAVLHAAVSRARQLGKKIIIDPKSNVFARYRGASVLTPNRSELQAACGTSCRYDDEIEAGARGILAEGLCEALVVTRGSDGLSIIRPELPAVHLPTSAHEVFDVSGAGDTVAATLSLGLAAGGGIVEACALANLAAGIVVGKRGTAIVTAEELAAAIAPFDARGVVEKLCSFEAAERLAGSWRDQGLRITFTNGCFDLLHPGHVSLLDRARRSGDRLIVGLNSDASVRRLKGPNRPVQDQVARATVLGSLKSVDAVVIFNEDTPLRLIEALQPDVLVKGAEYTIDTIVGAELVLNRGGRIVLADHVPGYSTTDAVKRIARSAPNRS